jgi:hypothetical protein
VLSSRRCLTARRDSAVTRSLTFDYLQRPINTLLSGCLSGSRPLDLVRQVGSKNLPESEPTTAWPDSSKLVTRLQDWIILRHLSESYVISPLTPTTESSGSSSVSSPLKECIR